MKKSRKLLLIIVVIIIFLGFVVAILPIPSINYSTNIYYHLVYSINKDEGNATINDIVSQTANYNTSPSRLTKIADIITQNFTDYWWVNQRNDRMCKYTNMDGTLGWNWCSPLYGTLLYGLFDSNPNYYDYVVDKIGNVTTRVTNDLSFDPVWIAYQKAGNCQAIAVFFNETASRSGFVTRIVRSKGIDHMWNEVEINGSWKFFDVQRYGEKSSNEMSYWFGDTINYSRDCNLTKYGVYVLNSTDYGYGDIITQSYDPENLCPHGTINSSTF